MASRTGLLPRKENETLLTPAGNHGVRQIFPNIASGINEVHRVVVVFFDTRGDSKDVRVKDNIFRREADLVDKNIVRTLADFDLASFRVRLTSPHRRP